MIYCVVPPELVDELYEPLARYYACAHNVTVIVDRRRFDRRVSDVRGLTGARQRRILRDRRRARVPGELPAIASP